MSLRPLGSGEPVGGGLDLDLPGAGVRLRGTRWPGHGVPVVLLHGLASQRRFWDLVAPRLHPHPVLALDQRGHGDSDQPSWDDPSAYSVPTVARDLAVALDAVGWSRAVVVGHSWGAAVALQFAADHPDRTLAVLALDGGFVSMRSGGDRAEVRARMEPPRLALPVEELRGLLRGGALSRWWTPEVEAAVLPIFGVDAEGLARARLPFDAHMAVVDGLLDHDAEAVLSVQQRPTWLVSCQPPDADPTWATAKQAGLASARQLLPEARLLTWGGAHHDVALQWPALVAGVVRAAAEEAALEGEQ